MAFKADVTVSKSAFVIEAKKGKTRMKFQNELRSLANHLSNWSSLRKIKTRVHECGQSIGFVGVEISC